MFTNVIRLELAKQRRTFLSALLVFVIILVSILTEGFLRDRNVVEVLRDIMWFFVLLGIPALALFTGPIAATQLRSDSNRNSEEPLPFSPIQKVFGSYFTNLILLLIGSAIFLSAALPFRSVPQIEVSPIVIALAVLQFHLLSFFFSYWINQPILGTALAGCLSAIEIAIFLEAKELVWDFSLYSIHFAGRFWQGWAIWAAVTGIAGAMVALWIVSKRVERGIRTFFVPGLISYLAALSAVFVLLMGMSLTSFQLQNRLLPTTFNWMSRFLIPPSLETTGAYFETATADLFRITPEGRQVLLKTPFKMKPPLRELILAYEDSANAAWFLVRDPDSIGIYNIWKSSAQGNFEHYASFRSNEIRPAFLAKREGSVQVYAFLNKDVALAEIQEGQHHNVEWKTLSVPDDRSKVFIILENIFRSEIQTGRFAKISSDQKSLIRTLSDGSVMQWTLPGKAGTSNWVGSIISPAYQKNGQPYFAIPIIEKNQSWIALCSPDGSILPLWNHRWESSEQLYGRRIAGGGIGWVRWKGVPVELLIVGKDGTAFPPLSMSGLIENGAENWPSILSMENSMLWIVMNSRFIKIDLTTGKTLISSRLENLSDYFRQPTREGLYIVQDDRIRLIDWDGKIRDLGPASLE